MFCNVSVITGCGKVINVVKSPLSVYI